MSKFLVGKTINEIKISSDKEALLFRCADGDHIVKVEADCCSSTWVESIESPSLGFPALVTDACDLDLNKDDISNDEYECLQFYGFKISTTKGDIVIDYRNESNGYYGGSLSWPDDKYYCYGVYGQNISSEEWVCVGFS